MDKHHFSLFIALCICHFFPWLWFIILALLFVGGANPNFSAACQHDRGICIM